MLLNTSLGIKLILFSYRSTKFSVFKVLVPFVQAHYVTVSSEKEINC